MTIYLQNSLIKRHLEKLSIFIRSIRKASSPHLNTLFHFINIYINKMQLDLRTQAQLQLKNIGPWKDEPQKIFDHIFKNKSRRTSNHVKTKTCEQLKDLQKPKNIYRHSRKSQMPLSLNNSCTSSPVPRNNIYFQYVKKHPTHHSSTKSIKSFIKTQENFNKSVSIARFIRTNFVKFENSPNIINQLNFSKSNKKKLTKITTKNCHLVSQKEHRPSINGINKQIQIERKLYLLKSSATVFGKLKKISQYGFKYHI